MNRAEKGGYRVQVVQISARNERMQINISTIQVTPDSREFVLLVFVSTRPKNIIIYLICAICLLTRDLAQFSYENSYEKAPIFL